MNLKYFTNGLWKENPTFVLVLGTCPTLATTTSGFNAMGMGLATTFVLLFSNIFVSLLKGFIPDKVRIGAFVVIIATFVTVVDLLMKAYTPGLYGKLGIYIPLIVANCILLGRAESFAQKFSVFPSALDGLGVGLGFTMALTSIGCVREILGSGSLFDIKFVAQDARTILLFIMPPGAFFTFGYLFAMVNRYKKGQ
ncbi:MAG: electron transport complex subunit E [Bacteroidota bacterium]|nr:electron transport complex subunit E [Bacteroidota bacterium]